VPVNVGGVTKDFMVNLAAQSLEVVSGTDAVFTATLTTTSGATSWGSNPVSASLDYGTCSTGQVALAPTSGSLVCQTPTIAATPDFVPQKNGPPTVTITIPTAGMSTGTYEAILRVRGTNSSGQPVVHVFPLQIAVNTVAGGSTSYVNVQGYVVYLITSLTSNTVYGRAVSRVAIDPNDPTLAIARKTRLVPWNHP